MSQNKYGGVTQSDTAKNGGDAVSVTTSTTAVVAANPRRVEVTLVNDGANVIYLGLGQAAVANKGIRLAASGGSYTTSAFNGAINAIAVTGTTVLCFTEI